MLIGIDGNEANVKNRVGIGVYALELLRQFKKMTLTKNVQFRIYLKDKPLSDLPRQDESWQYVVFGPRPFWTQFALPGKLWLEKFFNKAPTVFFSPTHYAPRCCPVPSVISVMDLSFVHFPEMFIKKDLWQLRRWTVYSIKQAKKILTISNWSKNDIIKKYQIASGKVEVTYLGYDKEKFKVKSQKSKVKSEIKSLKVKYKIEGDYLIFVGTLQPRKNLERLLAAFKRIDMDLRLVICGKRGWLFESIFKKVKELGLENRVIFTGYVGDDELPYLLAGAKCFVLPSLYEGFGITVVEAMASGIPVVVSKVSSLPEIVGNAGILVNPYRVDEITAGIAKALNDDGTLVKKGLQQVKKFSWERCARETLIVLKAENLRR